MTRRQCQEVGGAGKKTMAGQKDGEWPEGHGSRRSDLSRPPGGGDRDLNKG